MVWLSHLEPHIICLNDADEMHKYEINQTIVELNGHYGIKVNESILENSVCNVFEHLMLLKIKDMYENFGE